MYKSPLVPMSHQREALYRLTRRPSHPADTDVMAWLMEMGTGKSKVVLDEWQARVGKNELDSLLIIAPAGSYRNWDLDKPENPCEFTKQLDPALRKAMRTAAWVSHSNVQRRAIAELVEQRNGAPRVMLMNVEALSSIKLANEICTSFITKKTMVVVDESTKIKSWRAKRTRKVIDIGVAAGARRIMTGLATPKSPLDLYSQFAFLDWRIIGAKSYYAFRARYAVMRKMLFGGRSVDIVVGYRNVDELHRLIAPYSYRVTKEQCLDLAPKVYEAWNVELTPEQRRIYGGLLENATAEIGDNMHVTATIVIVQIMRLHELVLGHVTDELGNTHDVPENRTAALLEILDEHDGKAVIWVPYRRTLEKVVKALQAYGDDPNCVAAFHGGNRNTREEDENRFKTDPRCKYMVATQGAGGLGNNWTMANLVIYYGSTYDLEKRSQSEDRVHRQGQTNRVTYVDLVARGTVEEKILYALRKKIDMATTITGENYREWLI